MRPIDADALIANIKSDFEGAAGLMASSGALFAVTVLKSAPTLTLDDLRPKGRWDPDWWRPKCSLCGFTDSLFDIPVNPFNYCPICGAKMESGETYE